MERESHRPKRSLGQNFLVDPNQQRRIVEAVDPSVEDVVLEIGPGQGALTQHMVGQAGRLVGVEKDDRLAATLRARWGGRPDVDILNADALKLQPDEVGVDPATVKVVGNIPYNITTPLIFHYLAPTWRPRFLVLMIQREVADRILAPPGEKAYGALTVGVRSVANVERLFHVGRSAFRPVPRVDSTVIRIVPRRPSPVDPEEEKDLRSLTQALFGQRRKQIQKVLRTAPEYTLGADEVEALEAETGVDLTRRPETVDPERLIGLARALRARGRPGRAH